VADSVADYLLDIVDATRDHEAIALGASPRASLSLLRASQANAVCDGRTFITPTDVKTVARGALAHRIVASSGGDVHHCASLIDGILRRVPPPRG
jgi:MoxR-like ATPase